MLAAMLRSMAACAHQGCAVTPLAINGARATPLRRACITARLWRRTGGASLERSRIRGALSLALTTNLYVFANCAGGRGFQRYFADVIIAPIFVLFVLRSQYKQSRRAAVAACVLVFAGIGLLCGGRSLRRARCRETLGLGSGVAYAGVSW